MSENLPDPEKVREAFREYEAQKSARGPTVNANDIPLQDVTTIESAVKELEVKSKLESMANQIKKIKKDSTQKMVKTVIKLSGGTMSEKQAEQVLLILAILMFSASFYLFTNGSTTITELPEGYVPNPAMSHGSN